jgi:hypothetical protein
LVNEKVSNAVVEASKADTDSEEMLFGVDGTVSFPISTPSSGTSVVVPFEAVPA